MIIVSNSSPLVALSVIGKLHLLQDKFNTIMIPEAVWKEIALDGRDKPGADHILRSKWIKIEFLQNKKVAESLEKDIDYGESEAIALALEMDADIVLLDDKLARAVAKSLGLNILGTVGILIWAKKAGLIESLRTELHKLLIHGNFRLSNPLIRMALHEVGEGDGQQ